MRRLRVALLVVALAVPAASALAQDAATVQDVGWWTQTPGAQAKDDGAFEVARGPSGDLSVAAIRILVTGPFRAATLVLTESGGVGQTQAALRVCPTSAQWSPSNPGAWTDRPAPGCDRGSAELTRNQTGWSADVLSLITGSGPQPSLVVMPDPSGSNPVGFQVDFAAASLVVESDEGSAPPTPVPTSAPPPSGPTTAFPDPFVTDPAPVPPESDPAPEPADPIGAAPIQEPGTFVAEGDVVPPGDADSQPWGRVVLLVPLAAVAGAATAYARRVLRDRGIVRTT